MNRIIKTVLFILLNVFTVKAQIIDTLQLKNEVANLKTFDEQKEYIIKIHDEDKSSEENEQTIR